MNKEKLQLEAEKEFDKLQAEGHYELSDLKSKDYWIDGYVHAMQSHQYAVSGSLPKVLHCSDCGMLADCCVCRWQ